MQTATYHIHREAAGLAPRVYHRRRGLATLEIVLALPILLLLMALMVNFGVVASWKIRGLSVARFEAWRARHERADYNYPQTAAWWPTAAAQGRDGGGAIAVSTGLAEVDPNQLAPASNAIRVNDVFDVTGGMVHGYATIQRPFPMLGRLGHFDLRADAYLVRGQWQYHEMGYYGNNDRRSPIIYDLSSSSNTTATTTASNAYITTATNLYYTFYFNSPWREYLAPLDRDPEFIAYQGGAPDFHPRLQSFCTLDKSAVDERVDRLIERIEGRGNSHAGGVAETMAHAFRALYQRMIRDYEAQIAAMPLGSDTSALRALIAQLQQKITQLDTFLRSLSS